MNYLLIANNEEKIKKLLYDVADFLWIAEMKFVSVAIALNVILFNE